MHLFQRIKVDYSYKNFSEKKLCKKAEELLKTQQKTYIYFVYTRNAMETICLKMDGKLLKEVDKAVKANGFSTRTEFVREAIRSKLWEKEKEIALKNLEKYFGAGKGHRKTNMTEEEVGEIVFKKLAKRHNIKLD